MAYLPDEDQCAFFFDVLEQVGPANREPFVERVTGFLIAVSPRWDFGPGDVDRALRTAFAELWMPPPDTELREGRWARSEPKFDQVSKRDF